MTNFLATAVEQIAAEQQLTYDEVKYAISQNYNNLALMVKERERVLKLRSLIEIYYMKRLKKCLN